MPFPVPAIAQVALNMPRELSIEMNNWSRFLNNHALRLVKSSTVALSSSSSMQAVSADEDDGPVLGPLSPIEVRRPYALIMEDPSGKKLTYIGIAIIDGGNELGSLETPASNSEGNIQAPDTCVIAISDASSLNICVDHHGEIHRLLTSRPIHYNDEEIGTIYAIPADNFLRLLGHELIVFKEHQRASASTSWEIIAFTVALVEGFFWMALGVLIENPLYLMTAIGLLTFACNFPLELMRTYQNRGELNAETAKQIAVNSLILAIKFYGGAGAWITGLDLTRHSDLFIRSLAAGSFDATLTTLTSMALFVIEKRGVLSNIDYYRRFSVRQQGEISQWLIEQCGTDDDGFSDALISAFGVSHSSWLRDHVLLFICVLLAGSSWVIVDDLTSALTTNALEVIARSVVNGLAVGFTFWLPLRLDQVINAFGLYPQVLATPEPQFSSPEPTAPWRHATLLSQASLLQAHGAFSGPRRLETITNLAPQNSSSSSESDSDEKRSLLG